MRVFAAPRRARRSTSTNSRAGEGDDRPLTSAPKRPLIPFSILAMASMRISLLAASAAGELEQAPEGGEQAPVGVAVGVVEALVAAEPGRRFDFFRAPRPPQPGRGGQGQADDEEDDERGGGSVERQSGETRQAHARPGGRDGAGRGREIAGEKEAARLAQDGQDEPDREDREEPLDERDGRQGEHRGRDLADGLDGVPLRAGRGEGHAEELDVAGQGDGAREQGDDAEENEQDRSLAGQKRARDDRPL